MSAIIQPYHADSDDEDNFPLAQVQNAPPLPPGEHAVPIRCIDDHEHEAYVHNDSPMNACRTMFDELRYYLIDDLDRLVMEYVDDVFPLKSAQTFVLSSGEEPSVQEIVMTSENEVACVIPQQSTVKIFNLDSGTFTMSFSSSSKVIAAKFLDLQTVKLLVTSSWSDSLQIWNTENGECLHTIKSNWMPLLDVMRVMVPPDTTACLSKWRPSYRLRLVTASISKEQMLVYEVDENSCQLVSTCRVTPPDEWQVADDSEIPQLAIIRQQYALFTFPCTLDKNYLFYELYLLPMGEHVGGGHIVLSETPNAASLSSYTIRALDFNKASDNEHAEFPDLGISAPEGVRLYRLKIPASAPVSRPFATPPSSPIMRPMLSKTKSPPPMKIVLDHFNTLRWPFPERVTYFGAMPGWPRLVAVDSSGNMLIWDARTGAEVYYVSFVHSDMNKVTFLPSPSGRALLTLGSNEKYGEWKLWKRCFRS